MLKRLNPTAGKNQNRVAFLILIFADTESIRLALGISPIIRLIMVSFARFC